MRVTRKQNDHIIEILMKSSERLAEVLGDEFVGLILFGSWARGKARADSDVDILLVLGSIGGFDARVSIYSTLAENLRMPVTFVDVRLSEVTGCDYELTPLMLNILYDGIVVWDIDGVLKEFVERGRRLIERAKLVRYETPNSKYGGGRSTVSP